MVPAPLCVGCSNDYRWVVMNKHTVACLLVTFFSCLSFSIFTQAETDDHYKDEILQHLINPCFEYKARNAEPIEGLSEDDMIKFLKLASSENVLEIISVTLPIVRDKPEDARMGIYKAGRELCIKAAGGEL